MRGRGAWAALTGLAVAAAATSCSAHAAGGPTSSSATASAAVARRTAEPIAPCIDPEEQGELGMTAPAPGGAVSALVQGRGTTAVVFADMLEADLCQWWGPAVRFASQGYRTAVFRYTGADLADQLVAVSEELQRRGVRRLVLVGSAEGGAAALVAAARLHAGAVVTLSAPASYAGLDAVRAVTGSPVPVLLTAGEEDGTAADDARRVYDASPSPGKHLEVVVSSAHGTHLYLRVESLVEQFIRDNTPPTP